MRASGILETALYVDDLDAAEAFYRDVIGLELLTRLEDRHVFFRCGQGVFLLFNAQATQVPPKPDAKLPVPPHGARGAGHACFAAERDELDRWRAHLEARGVEIEADFEWPSSKPDEPSGGRSIYIRDPAGNSIEFATPSIWGL